MKTGEKVTKLEDENGEIIVHQAVETIEFVLGKLNINF